VILRLPRTAPATATGQAACDTGRAA
jgi:hypothetical protein